MKLSEAYPSPFLKADDLGGRSVNVTIARAVVEEIGQGADKERKLILSFVGKEKKLVLNKTNAKTIAKLYGDDTDDWLGKSITLAAREVEFQGEMTMAIRVSLVKPGAGQAAASAASATANPPVAPGDAADDSVPF